jgi:hypothetical protein
MARCVGSMYCCSGSDWQVAIGAAAMRPYCSGVSPCLVDGSDNRGGTAEKHGCCAAAVRSAKRLAALNTMQHQAVQGIHAAEAWPTKQRVTWLENK